MSSTADFATESACVPTYMYNVRVHKGFDLLILWFQAMAQYMPLIYYAIFCCLHNLPFSIFLDSSGTSEVGKRARQGGCGRAWCVRRMPGRLSVWLLSVTISTMQQQVVWLAVPREGVPGDAWSMSPSCLESQDSHLTPIFYLHAFLSHVWSVLQLCTAWFCRFVMMMQSIIIYFSLMLPWGSRGSFSFSSSCGSCAFSARRTQVQHTFGPHREISKHGA